MKRALLVGVLSLSACSRFNDQEGHRYLCTRDAVDPSTQCPGGWVCALDGFCVDPQVPATLKCAAPSDCTGGWHCTLDGTCVDPMVPGPYRCTTNAHCTAGWQCTLDGTCVDPKTPGAYRCESNANCTAGWHCGKNKVCYSRADAGDVECRSSVPEDCAVGWRCGLNGRCHDTDAGAPYDCVVDGDCERAWRCAFNNRCLDSSSDGLLANADSGTPISRVVTPARPRAEVVAGTSPYEAPDVCGRTEQRASFSFGRGATVTRMSVWPGFGGQVYPMGCDAGVVREVNSETASFSFAATTRVSQLVELPGLTLAMTADQQVTALISVDGGLVPQPISLPFLPTTLRAGGDARPRWFAFNDQQVAIGDPDGGFVVVGPFASPSRPYAEITDVTAWDGESGGVTQYLAATTTALYAISVDAGLAVPPAARWVPRTMHETWCEQDFPLSNRRTRKIAFPQSGGTRFMASVVRTTFGSPGSAQFYDEVLTWEWVDVTDAGTGFCRELDVPGDPYRVFDYSTGRNRCSPCENSRAVVDLAVSYSEYRDPGAPTAQTYDVEAACENPDGGPVQVSIFNTSNCGTAQLGLLDGIAPYQPNMARSTSSARTRVVAGQDGQLWWSGERGHIALTPVLLDAPPSVVSGKGNSLTLTRPQVFVDERSSSGLPKPIVRGASFRFNPSNGTFGSFLSDDIEMVCSVKGRGEWFLFLDPDTSTGQSALVAISFPTPSFDSLGVVAGAAPQSFFTPPYQAGISDRGDGGVTLLVSSGDALYASDVSSTAVNGLRPSGGELLDDPKVPRIGFVTVPLVRSPITSMVVLPPDPEPSRLARYVEAWLIAAGRVFRVAADDAIVWRTTESVTEPKEAAEVWSEGRRVRLGYRDGTVYTLPSRVKAAAAITEGTSVVLDYEGVCNQSFALTTTGLKRLVVDRDNGVGRWEPVALASMSDPGLTGAKLWASDDALYVFFARGIVERVSGFSCPR
ncbi:MAG: hypothetical protein JNG84_07075 [Archangium sp.]|nr:hypothetical protein [Archangium sp.]